MNTKLLITVLALSGLTACSDGAVTTITTNDLMTPNHNYEIDTWGTNSEIYEFTPKSNSNKSCVLVILDSGNDMGLQCFDKQI